MWFALPTEWTGAISLGTSNYKSTSIYSQKFIPPIRRPPNMLPHTRQGVSTETFASAAATYHCWKPISQSAGCLSWSQAKNSFIWAPKPPSCRVTLAPGHSASAGDLGQGPLNDPASLLAQVSGRRSWGSLFFLSRRLWFACSRSLLTREASTCYAWSILTPSEKEKLAFHPW